MNFASPFWQGMLFLGGGLFLLWAIWGGWRRGVIRSGIHFGAFVVSGLLGILAWQATSFVVDKILPGYGLIAGSLAGSLVTLITLGLMLFLGAILFKKTSQQPSSTLRLLYGGGGAFFGLLTGLVLLWGGITLIRTFGVAAQMAVDSRRGEAVPAPAKALLTLRDSLELGPAGKFVGSVDALPPDFYETLARVGKLTADQDAMMRFLDYPGVQEIMQNPRMARLMADPAVAQAAADKNLFALMGNKALLDAVQDPALQKQLTSFDLKKALDYTFPTPQSSPSPKSKP